MSQPVRESFSNFSGTDLWQKSFTSTYASASKTAWRA